MGNSFSLDPNCKALWKLDSGALTTDSISTNTLTNDGADEDTTNEKEGTACASFVAANTDYLTITDADLASGFPTKSGDTTKDFSVCFWIRIATLPPATGEGYLVINKWDELSTPKRLSWQLALWPDGVDTHAFFVLGFNNGESYESKKHLSPLSATTWYHITISYQNSDKAYAVRIRNASGGVVGSDLTGTATLDANKLTVNTEPIMMGVGCSSNPSWWFNGQLDEIAIFSDIITADEATRIAKGNYPETIYPATIYDSSVVTDVISVGLAYRSINSFSLDSNCKALWKFNSGALTTDSISTNTLTNDGVDGETTDYTEGDGCGHWVIANTDFMYITDANLTSEFPWKSTDTAKTGSVCFWMKAHTFAGDGAENDIFNKWDDDLRSFGIRILNTSGSYQVRLALGFNGGLTGEFKLHESSLSLDTWYHITVSYDNSDKSWAIRVRDRSGNTVGTDATGTATLDANKLSVNTAALAIGTYARFLPGDYFDGLLDEMVVFSDVITADEATRIARGNYPESVYPSTIYESVTITESIDRQLTIADIIVSDQASITEDITAVCSQLLIEISIYDELVLTELSVVSTGYLAGSVVWGHDTGVDESNVENLSSWIGTGEASGSGDDEIITLVTEQYMDSSDVNISGMVTLAWNKYKTGDDPTVKYKTAAAQESLDAAEWIDYTDQFNSLGWVRIRIEE